MRLWGHGSKHLATDHQLVAGHLGTNQVRLRHSRCSMRQRFNRHRSDAYQRSGLCYGNYPRPKQQSRLISIHHTFITVFVFFFAALNL
ncbi:hypothetical protein L1887_10709 [Cichorium endivia]|nr:hypothetical protein L1887_10709 [Cichorium endivia]